MSYPYRPISSFKAYDVRGTLGVDIDEDIAYRIGFAMARHLNPTQDTTCTIVVGADSRPTSDGLKKALAQGVMNAGTSIIDLGMSGTEEVYFATSHYGAVGGAEITASHNPLSDNGIKFVGKHSTPIGRDSGLKIIKEYAEEGNFIHADTKGTYHHRPDKSAYIDHLLSYIDPNALSPLKVVVNCGNSCAVTVIDLLKQKLRHCPISFIPIHHSIDPSFPNGIPNPMLSDNRKPTAQAVIAHQADLAVAFDGDFDRCFFFDETGQFIDGTYMVGLLASAFLQKKAGERIVYDPRNIFATEQIIKDHSGVGVLSQSGHSFIKQTMRNAQAVYGGEMSAHHYFKDFNYCDSGMIPWLLVLELLSKSGRPLSSLVGEMRQQFPISGEINFVVDKPLAMVGEIQKALGRFDSTPANINTLDGLSADFGNWRFNVRSSNTEPLLRLNVESRGDRQLLAQKTALICQYLTDKGASLASH